MWETLVCGRCESLIKAILSVIPRCHALFVVGFHSTIKLALWDDRYHLVKFGDGKPAFRFTMGLPVCRRITSHFLDLFGQAVSRHFQRDASVGAANGMEGPMVPWGAELRLRYGFV